MAGSDRPACQFERAEAPSDSAAVRTGDHGGPERLARGVPRRSATVRTARAESPRRSATVRTGDRVAFHEDEVVLGLDDLVQTEDDVIDTQHDLAATRDEHAQTHDALVLAEHAIACLTRRSRPA